MCNTRPSSFDEYYKIADEYKNFDFNSIAIKPSIDCVKVSVRYKDFPTGNMIKFLRKHQFEAEWHLKSKKKYKAQKRFNGKIYLVYCTFNDDAYRTCFDIKNPSKDFLQYLEHIFRAFDYCLSEVEYSLDFHGCDNESMFMFLASHTSIKGQRKFFNVIYDSSQYLNCKRTSTKCAGIIYIKKESGLEFIRIETIIKQSSFKEINVSSITDAFELPPDIVFEKWRFEQADFSKIHKNYSKAMRRKHKTPLNYDEFESNIFSSMNGCVNGGGLPATKKYVTTLIKQPHDYFQEHTFHYKFFDAISKITFV